MAKCKADRVLERKTRDRAARDEMVERMRLKQEERDREQALQEQYERERAARTIAMAEKYRKRYEEDRRREQEMVGKSVTQAAAQQMQEAMSQMRRISLTTQPPKFYVGDPSPSDPFGDRIDWVTGPASTTTLTTQPPPMDGRPWVWSNAKRCWEVAKPPEPAPENFVATDRLVQGYKAAQASECMVTVQIETDGVMVMAQDGDGYVTELVTWEDIRVSCANPLPGVVRKLEKQMLTRGRLEEMLSGHQ